MTRETFRTRVIQEAKRCKGETVYDFGDTEKINALINEQLDELAREVGMISVSAAPLTLVADTETYDVRADGMDRRMATVLDVVIEGSSLRNFQDKAGAVSPQDMAEFEGDWTESASGRPKRWMSEGANSIRLWPAPDEAYRCHLVGFGYPNHPETDSESEECPDALLEPAIKRCAFVFCGRGAGYSNELVLELEMMAAKAIEKYSATASQRMFGRRVRGGRIGIVRRIGG